MTMYDDDDYSFFMEVFPDGEEFPTIANLDMEKARMLYGDIVDFYEISEEDYDAFFEE